MHLALSSLATLALAATASAHGYVDKIWIDGVEYEGYQPWRDPYYATPPPRINREVYSNYPVEDVYSIDMQCGGYENSGSKPAALEAPATAGSEVTLQWTTWPDSHHGPVSTYMARCPGSCTTYMPGNDTVWFKVHHEGQRPDWTWAADDFITDKPYKFTIPASLAPGSYIIRHEILALHSAYNYPGSQWYPSCIQISLASNGTSTGPEEKVAIPGYINEHSPGVVFSIYDHTGSPFVKIPYPIPGPEVWEG